MTGGGVQRGERTTRDSKKEVGVKRKKNLIQESTVNVLKNKKEERIVWGRALQLQFSRNEGSKRSPKTRGTTLGQGRGGGGRKQLPLHNSGNSNLSKDLVVLGGGDKPKKQGEVVLGTCS